jgi:hypothetical protein
MSIEVAMVGREQSPLWDKVMNPVARTLDFAFGCHHHHMSRVFTVKGRTHQVCCDCGKHFDYSLRTMSKVRHRKLAAPATVAHAVQLIFRVR